MFHNFLSYLILIFVAIFVSQQHTDLTMSDRESSEDEVCLIVLLWGNVQMEYDSATQQT